MRGSRNFRQGGGGPVQSDKKALTSFFFLVPSLFYKSQMVNFKEIYHFSRFQRGSNIFRGGVQLFPGGGGGSNCLHPIETHITCDFPGGSGPPCPPLWIRTWAAFRLHGFIRVCMSDSRLYKKLHLKRRAISIKICDAESYKQVEKTNQWPHIIMIVKDES